MRMSQQQSVKMTPDRATLEGQRQFLSQAHRVTRRDLSPLAEIGIRLLRRRATAPPTPSSPGTRTLKAAVDRSKKSPGPATAHSSWVPLERRLVQRITMGWNQAELEAVAELGYEAYLESQLDYEAIDDSEFEAAINQFFPSVKMTVAELVDEYEEAPFQPLAELMVAAVFRSFYSPRQLFERMVVFWTDHFNIDIFGNLGNFFKPTDDREVIRSHALGKFPDLLSASAHSPAMLNYLTNDSNNKEHPNENYARELMELHTLGADNGYTQEDVQEVARCFTGWRFWGPDAGPQIGTFFFDFRAHDFGSKVVLGNQIPAQGGIQDGETVVEILANRPETAQFISLKLARYLWGYDPPQELVDQVAQEYLATGGDIRSMLRVVLSPFWLGQSTPKFKRPQHLISSAIRGLFAQVGSLRFLWDSLSAMGHLPFAWTPPDGYPDSQSFWSDFLLARWNFADGLSRESSGVSVDLPFLTPAQSPEEIVEALNVLLFDGRLPAKHGDALRGFLESAELTQERILQAVGLAVASPEFQLY